MNLAGFITFRTEGRAQQYVPVYSDDDLMLLAGKEALAKQVKLVIGGGSNILLTGDVKGTVVHVLTRGFSVVKETAEHVFVRVAAGEPWDDFVSYTVQNGWGGLENLSLIPGTAGASPVQNIGAYGVEVKDFIDEVRCFDIKQNHFFSLTNQKCRFGYRDSIFKNKLKKNIIITHVTFRLQKKPVYYLHYEALAQEIKNYGALSLDSVRKAVIAIRQRKLPDPALLPNAGSFFKNPVISVPAFNQLQKKFPSIPHHEENGKIKIPAAWLIEQCGWKGFRQGDAGVHQTHALILVNYGKASGKEILNLSRKIIASVKKRFGISLIPEVTIV